MEKNQTLNNKTIHFIGIAGAGMIALAQYLRSRGGMRVTGSDLRQTPALKELAQRGVTVFHGHCASQVKHADIVVYSTAITSDNSERQEAMRLKRLCLPRGSFLAALMAGYNHQVAIAGTHGKTTTTGMAIHMLDSVGITPSFMIGGELPPYYVNGRFSDSSTFVTESDESDGSFLKLTPNYLILTNIEAEHLHYYKTEECMNAAFRECVDAALARDAVVIVNADDSGTQRVLTQDQLAAAWTVGIDNPSARLYATNLRFSETGVMFDVVTVETVLGTISLRAFGHHNVSNALAVIALALSLHVSFSVLKKGLASFCGVKRRMQYMGTYMGHALYDDYAHHPTEIRVTLAGLQQAKKKPIVCLFQPHRSSRVRDQLHAFATSFDVARYIIVLPIYQVDEETDDQLLNHKLADAIKENVTCSIACVAGFEEAKAVLKTILADQDVIIAMGAGDVSGFVHELAQNTDEVMQSSS